MLSSSSGHNFITRNLKLGTANKQQIETLSISLVNANAAREQNFHSLLQSVHLESIWKFWCPGEAPDQSDQNPWQWDFCLNSFFKILKWFWNAATFENQCTRVLSILFEVWASNYLLDSWEDYTFLEVLLISLSSMLHPHWNSSGKSCRQNFIFMEEFINYKNLL